MNLKTLSIISIIAVLATVAMPSIPQNPDYHQFADQRPFFGISNFLNVVSSLPFIVIGLAGMTTLGLGKKPQRLPGIKIVYQVFFCGVLLVGFGSSYYHLSPDNATLLWDRLPMAVSFMSFFTIVLGEYIDERLSRNLFVPLLLTGLASVFYWYWTELTGEGDLRAYLLVQFLPILLTVIILSQRKSCFSHGHFFWMILACYGAAKGFEMTDEEFFNLTGLISGHTMKHLLSAIGPLLLLVLIFRRERIGSPVSEISGS